jgi:tight adherence protein B
MFDGNSDLVLYLLLGFLTLCVGTVIYVLAWPYLSGEKQTEKRIQEVAEAKSVRTTRRARDDEVNNRRRQVADTLRDLEDRQKAKEKVTLRLRLQRAGLDVTPKSFWIASAICGVATGIIVWLSSPGMHPGIPLAAAFVGGFGMPRWIVNKMIARRQKKFLDEFANAIDVIVRGVKSGLPLNECLKIISTESPSPVREEFHDLVEQQRVGVPLSECFGRMMQRLPLAEVKFFGIVIGIQAQAGDNLSEALGNLSGVLRDRKKMEMKVKALSAEAKASAGVLIALPFIVIGMVYMLTPDYIIILFRTKVGNFLLLCAGVWMSIGIMIMRKMINFKY